MTTRVRDLLREGAEMVKAEKDPRIDIICKSCGFEYVERPVTTNESGDSFYSSDADFCSRCGSSNIQKEIHYA